MSEVMVEGQPYPFVLEEDERLELSPLQLQPATNVIQGKGALVNIEGCTGCTKQEWVSLQASGSGQPYRSRHIRQPADGHWRCFQTNCVNAALMHHSICSNDIYNDIYHLKVI